jgi:carbon storage regulator CsrA
LPPEADLQEGTMLVLTRKPGEQIVIGNTIRITVVAVGHGRVKIGVEAPPDVSIDRQEVHARKQLEAAAGPPAEGAEPRPVVVDAHAEAPALHNRIADRLPVNGNGHAVAAGTNGHGLEVHPRRGPDPRKPR